MKKILLATIFILGMVACKSSSPYGKETNEPFTSKKHMSDKRYLRGSGKGQSVKSQVAKKKADIAAKSEVAAQVYVYMKEVADQYMSQRDIANATEVLEKFELLSREVVNVEMADLRKVDEKQFYDGQTYTVFILYEVRKKSMLKFMEDLAETQAEIDDNLRKEIKDIIEDELKNLED